MPMYPISSPTAAEVSVRCNELVHLNDEAMPYRERTRDIMDGGEKGLSRLVGKDLHNPRAVDMIPVANMMLKANDRLAQKIGKYPTPKCDSDSDDQSPQERADKRVKILTSWDRAAKMKLMLRQQGRWLPGYGLSAWTYSIRTDMNGDPYPHAGLRDPFDTFPSPWTFDQRPRDIAFRHVISLEDLAKVNPEAATKIRQKQQSPVGYGSATGYLPRAMGGVVLSPSGGGGASWGNQSGKGIEVFEYVCETGTYWVHPNCPDFLSYVPNPLKGGPMFRIGKRFAFNKLQGQYDQLVGLMAAVVRLNLLAVMAVESGVNSETAIIGHMANGVYKTGPGAINYLLPGSTVEKVNNRIPFEALTQLDKLERQLRSMATYPVTDDGISPNSFVTGMGLEELKGSVELEVEEYHDIVADLLEGIDSDRLELADNLMTGGRYKVWGVSKGAAFSTTYRPDQDIKGEYITRRVFGLLSKWDDPNKVVTGVALRQNEVISTEYLRDNIDGLDEHERMKDQIRDEKIEMALMGMLMQTSADPNSPMFMSAVKSLIDQLPDGDMKDLLTQNFITAPEEAAAQEQQAVGLPPGGPPEGSPTGPIPPTTTILNRLTNTSRPVVGVQTVQQAS